MDHPDKTRQRVQAAKEYVLKNFNPGNYSGKIESRLKQIKGTKIETSHSVQALFSVDFLADALQGEFERRDAEIAERERQIASLNQAVVERDGQITQITSSNSWKMTLPLREARRWSTNPMSQTKRYWREATKLAKSFYMRLFLI
jgi:hypothetical protein